MFVRQRFFRGALATRNFCKISFEDERKCSSVMYVTFIYNLKIYNFNTFLIFLVADGISITVLVFATSKSTHCNSPFTLYNPTCLQLELVSLGK